MRSPALHPRFPVYIPSRSRWSSRHTMRALDRMGVDYRVIVEADQLDQYAAVLPAAKLLILDPRHQDEYDPCDDLGRSKPLGPGPARNMAWADAEARGYPWHWVMDDNIACFYWRQGNREVQAGDAAPFVAMEDFALRYTNVGMAGPNYDMFAPVRQRLPPFITGTRIYSCNLIRNDTLPVRWRGRYNEDTDLSLRMLKAGWNTVLFNAFLQKKIRTQTLKGGNTEAFYNAEGTLPKSAMLVAMHPDVASIVYRFGRAHHVVDYRRWRGRPLVPAEHSQPGRRWRTSVTPRPERQPSRQAKGG